MSSVSTFPPEVARRRSYRYAWLAGLPFVVAAAGLGWSGYGRPALVAEQNALATQGQPPAVGARAVPAEQKANGKKKDRGKTPKEVRDFPPGWQHDYAQALVQAKATGQPLLVLFH